MIEAREKSARWSKSGKVCPGCGSRDLWVEVSEGEFGCGEPHVCTNCRRIYTIHGAYEAAEELVDMVRSGR